MSEKCVKFYFETEFDMFQARGSVASVEAYVTALFNQVSTLYQNENIITAISEIKVWTTTDPYTSSSTSNLLSQFQGNISSFNGDLGQLLTFRNIGGGIVAGFNGLCNSNPDNSLSVSGVYNTSIISYPTYCWNVMVVTHEFGHLFGSRHTHACVWNGNNTAIDGCSGFTEGSCGLPSNPSGGGTIMSYCHQNVGINFSLGFGTQPGNVIRDRVNNTSCLNSCCPDDANITSNVLSGNSNNQEAENTLTASNTIYADGNAIYHSNEVILTTGFLAAKNSNFRAYKEGCTGNFASRISLSKGKDDSFGSLPLLTSPTTLKIDAENSSNNLDSQLKFNVFPNPSDAIFDIQFLVKLESSYKVEVINSNTRQKVFYKDYSKSKLNNSINLERFNSGTYILKVTYKGRSITRKIIKK